MENGNRIHLEISSNSINHAIEEIDESIWNADNEDEFECINLGIFRYADEWVEIAEQFIPEGGYRRS